MRDRVNTDRLVKDLHNVARDAEDLVKATAGEATEQVSEARSRLASTLESAEETCMALQDRAVAATGKVIRQHPLQTMGAAFGIGILIGVLVNRGSYRS